MASAKTVTSQYDIKKAVGAILESLIQRYDTGWELWIKCNSDGSIRIKEGCDRVYSSSFPRERR